jgi:Flp pilus assembly pilin Flp
MVDRLNTLIVNLFARVQLQREEGQGTLEYALVLAVVAGAVAAAVILLGGAISTKVGTVVTSITG